MQESVEWIVDYHPGRARVGVILTPLRPFPETWDDRRMYVSDLEVTASILNTRSLPDYRVRQFRMTLHL